MQPTTVIQHVARRNLVPLSPGVTPGTASELYDAVRYKSGEAVIRAGQDPSDNWYIYGPKKDSKLAAATYKAASIKRHRQAMATLLFETSHTLQGDTWTGGQQKKAIISLRMMALKKDVVNEDFTVKELTSVLKPISDHLRGHQRLLKTSAIKTATSPLLKTRRDYLSQFLKMSESDLKVMQQALFSKDDIASFQEKKLILKSIFSLIKTYLHQKEGKKTLAELVQQSPQQDLLLKFAGAWLGHVDERRLKNRPNLLVVFSWQKTMTAVCKTILAAQPAKSPATPVIASPERSMMLKKMMSKSGFSIDGTELDTPTKFPAQAKLVPSNDQSVQSSPASQPATPVSLQRVAKSDVASAQIADAEQREEVDPETNSEVEYQLEAGWVEAEGAYEISVDPGTIARRTGSRV